MGCDIHLYCEYRKNKNSEWQSADYFMLTTERHDTIRLKHEITSSLQLSTVHLYDDRNYELFAILANVRNDEGIICIKEPVGLPDDLSFWVQKEYDIYRADAHSASYLYRSEIVNWLNTYCDYSLYDLLERIELRMREIFNIWDFYSAEKIKSKLDEVDENFRIVFWFDN